MRRTIAIVRMLITLLTGLLHCPLASALNVNYTDRGWYTPAGSHNPNNLSYIAGDIRGAGCTTCVNDSRNFFVFDLAGVTVPIATAKLAVFVPSQPGPGFVSADPSENYELHDVVTPIATLRAGTGGVAVHSDLGSGVVYGSRTITAADMGNVVEITLNSSAISALDAATGLIGIGGSITTLDAVANDEYAFAWTNTGTETTQLRLTFVSGPPGDFNFDGLVDASDYVVWRKSDGTQAGYNQWRAHFGQTVGSGSFDFNFDGLVDAGDYVVWRKSNGTQASYNQWRAHFGQTVGSGSLFNSTVPEPFTLVLLGIGAISLLGYRKAKSHG